MNVTTIKQTMDESVGGNEITRGKPIWQLASENNKRPRRVSKRFVTKVRQVPLT